MSAPVVFISAASDDLREKRELLSAAFDRAGLKVLSQGDRLSAPAGEVLAMLRQHIDKSDFVVHLAGIAYGAEPETPPFETHPDFICSYTQFEYYYAHQQGKSVISFVCGNGFPYLPFIEKGNDDTDRYRRSNLQEQHRERVAKGRWINTPLVDLKSRPLSEQVDDEAGLLKAMAAAIGTINDLSMTVRTTAANELTPVEISHQDRLIRELSAIHESVEKLHKAHASAQLVLDDPATTAIDANLLLPDHAINQSLLGWPTIDHVMIPDIANRRAEIDYYQEFVQGRTDKRFFFVEGESGMGKTLLYNEFCEVGLQMPEGTFASATFLGEGGLNARLPNLRSQLSMPESTHADKGPNEAFLSDLTSLNRPVILVLDAYDKLGDPEQQWMVLRFLEALATHKSIRLVLFGTVLPAGRKGDRWRLNVHRSRIGVISEDDWRQWALRCFECTEAQVDLWLNNMKLTQGDPIAMGVLMERICKRKKH